MLYVGTHQPSEAFWSLAIPLCVSRNRLTKRKVHAARAPWILDSGAFTELHRHGRYTFTVDEYRAVIEHARRFGNLQWAAPMDWMCEPFMLERTGLTVAEHIARTVDNYLALKPDVIPVVQGYAPRDYDRCISRYQDAGVDLEALPVVGLGSVCRRSRTKEIIRLVRYLSDYGINWHGFGLKGDSYRALRGLLASADSMAWSLAARKQGRNANSPREALLWHAAQLA